MPTFKPKTDKELNDERLLAKGEYDFQIVAGVDKIGQNKFKSGNEGIALKVGVYDSVGNQRVIDDNLVFSEKAMFKLSQFAKCVGLYGRYQDGEIGADECVGRSGRCKVDIEPEGQYPAKNKITGYVVPKAGAAVSSDGPPIREPDIDHSQDSMPWD